MIEVFKNLRLFNAVYTVPERRLSRTVSNITTQYPAKTASFCLK